MDAGVMRERLYAEALRRICGSLSYAITLVPPFSEKKDELVQLRSQVQAMYERERRAG